MSDSPLIVGGGDTLEVESDELFRHADVHARLAVDLAEVRGLLNQSVWRIDAAPAVASARHHVSIAMEIAEWLPVALHAAALRYGLADRLGDAAKDAVGDIGAWWLGRLSMVAPGFVALTSLTTAIGGLGAILGAALAEGKSPLQYLHDHPEIYTTPQFAGLFGTIAEHGDEALVGYLGLPVSLAPLLGGTPGTARLLIATHPFGAFGDTPVRLERTIPLLPPQPPTSLTEATTRIKSMDTSGAQVIVERYELADGTSVANVYIDGTIDWSLWPTDEPWDMPSNVAGVAQLDHVAAAEAVKLAMREAGIDAQTPVQLFGYSQGGIQAALVAHQKEFNVVGLVTIGSPVGDIELDESIDALSIGHLEDPVFALGDDQVNPHTVEVTTERFPDGEPIPNEEVFPGHQFKPYVETLQRVDGAGDPRVTSTLEQILGRTAGAVATTSMAFVAARGPELCVP